MPRSERGLNMKYLIVLFVLVTICSSAEDKAQQQVPQQKVIDKDKKVKGKRGLQEYYSGYGGAAYPAYPSGDIETVAPEGSLHYHPEPSVQELEADAFSKKVPEPYEVIIEKRVPFKVEVPVDKPYPVYVPKPYPVYVEKKIPYEIKVPVPQPYTVEKRIPVPVKIPVDKPYPVHIPKPFPVYVEKKVPYTVYKKVPYPVKVRVDKPYPVRIPIEKTVRYPVERPIPYPVKVPVEKPVPIPIVKPIPVPVEKQVPYPIEQIVPYPVKVKYKIPIQVPRAVPVPKHAHLPHTRPIHIPIHEELDSEPFDEEFDDGEQVGASELGHFTFPKHVGNGFRYLGRFERKPQYSAVPGLLDYHSFGAFRGINPDFHGSSHVRSQLFTKGHATGYSTIVHHV